MAQVIVIHDNKTLEELLQINLTTFVGAEVIPRKNAEDAIMLMDILPSVQLVVCAKEIVEEPTGEKIVNYFLNKGLETPVIVMGGDKTSDNVLTTKKLDWEAVVDKAAKILGVTEDSLKKRVLPDYIPLSLDYFYPINTSCCDVFIRIKKSADDYQFLKRIHAGDTYSRDMVDKYKEQGLTEFFIPKDRQEDFTRFISNHLVQKLENPDLPEDEKLETMGEAYNVAMKEVFDIGFNSSTIQLTDTVINEMIHSAENTPEISPLLFKVVNSKTGYMYQHAHLTTVLTTELLPELGLDKGDNISKLAHAAFFHDISLVEKEYLAKIHNFEELEKAEINEEDYDLVFNHALEGSVIIQKHPDAPLDVDLIIKQHHGTRNGKGYSNHSFDKLSELSKVFIVADEGSKIILGAKESKKKVKPVVDSLREIFKGGELENIIQALDIVLKEKAKS